MTKLAVALIVLIAVPAYAQQPMYRCVDQNNRVSFSDKPGPGCTLTQKPAAAKAAEKPAAPGKAAAKSTKQEGKKVAKAPPPETPAQRCARVRGQISDMKPADRQRAREQVEREC